MVTTNVLQADIIGRGARGFRLTNYSNGQLTAVSSQRSPWACLAKQSLHKTFLLKSFYLRNKENTIKK